MTKKRTARPERGLIELHRDDPERADALVWGRRGVLGGAALATMGAALGAAIPFAGRMPAGLLPAALAQGAQAGGGQPNLLRMEGKAPLVVLGERPLVAETPERRRAHHRGGQWCRADDDCVQQSCAVHQ